MLWRWVGDRERALLMTILLENIKYMHGYRVFKALHE